MTTKARVPGIRKTKPRPWSALIQVCQHPEHTHSKVHEILRVATGGTGILNDDGSHEVEFSCLLCHTWVVGVTSEGQVYTRDTTVAP